MDYRQLGRSGLRVSSLTLGTAGFGDDPSAAVGRLSVDDCRRQLDLCLDAGVNVVDTADVYSGGRAEEILGEALGGGRRGRLLITTKLRMATGPGPNDSGSSRLRVIAGVELALRRLRVEHIDLLSLHEWDGLTPLEETLQALDTLVRDGKVRYLGCSNFTAWQTMKALGIADRRGYERFVSTQIHYTPQAREAEFEIVPTCLDQGLGVVVWSPLGGGLLSGKYRRGRDAPAGSRHIGGWDEPPVHDEEAAYDLIEVLVEVGEAHGVSAAQVTLAWLLTRPGVASLVIGANSEGQLRDNLAAAALELTPDEVARIEAASRPPLPYPLWHQVKYASDRLGPADIAVLAPYLG